MNPPALAAIVLSQGPRPTVVNAVASLVRQDEPCEIVVIHSGGGDVVSLLKTAGLHVKVVVVPHPLLPGGARNLGVDSTVAPYVAFLADDCVALDGWARLRRDYHDAGHDAVASALVGHRPNRPVALAAHLSLFVNRMPKTRPDRALKYGVSYSRELLRACGPFRDDLRGGEDSEYNARVGGPDAILWAPLIQTAHTGPERLTEFLRDQRARGRRMVRARKVLDDGIAGYVFRDALLRIFRTVTRSFQVMEPRSWPLVILAAPIIAAGGIAYAGGAASESRRP